MPDSTGTSDTVSTRGVSSARNSSASAPQVTTMAASDGSANARSHASSGGMCSPNTTRLAGFEIGNTKLAALAISAQANR